MNLATINHIIAAILFWLLLLFAIIYFSDIIYDNARLEKHSYDFGQVEQIAEKIPEPVPEKAQELSLEQRLNAANSMNGKKIFAQCATCHTANKDGRNMVGPNLWGVVGRPFAAIKNYHYSKAMLEKANITENEIGDRKWDLSNLDAFLQSPKQYIKGTSMAFMGIENAQNRADLLLYLQSLND